MRVLCCISMVRSQVIRRHPKEASTDIVDVALLENIRGEDFEIYYNNNSFRFMGNGLTLREERKEDLAFYLLK
jgi:uncharacterized protein YfaA (DUF2138 family)